MKLEFLLSVFEDVVQRGTVPKTISSTVTDSREAIENSLFIARRGEATDGHKYIEAAYSKGARFFIVEKDWLASSSLDSFQNAAFFGVDDATKALGELARSWREQLKIPVLLITGSNGKTTTKEMLRSILSTCAGEGIASRQSYNNHVGLPQTILEVRDEHNWLLVEAGMNHSGELDYLAQIAAPDFSAILNIAPAHLGNFDSIDEIAEAKCEVIAHTKSRMVLNSDDARLVAAADKCRSLERVYFGTNADAQFRISNIRTDGPKGISFSLKDSIEVKLPHIGAHNAFNASAALALFSLAFPKIPLEEAARALAASSQAPLRLQIEHLAAHIVLNDCYNANPSSVEAALKTAAEIAGKDGFTAILGDMLELGEHSEVEHTRLGELAANLGAKRLIAVGNFANYLKTGAETAGLSDIVAVDSATEAEEAVFAGSLSKVVLIKASRGVSLETVFTALKNRLDALSPTISPQ